MKVIMLQNNDEIENENESLVFVKNACEHAIKDHASSEGISEKGLHPVEFDVEVTVKRVTT